MQKEFVKISDVSKYYDLYLQSHTLLLHDVFNNFRNMCLKIYELDPARFLSAPRLALKAAFNKE